MQKFLTLFKLIILFSTTTFMLLQQNWEVIVMVFFAVIFLVFALQPKKFPLQRFVPLLVIAAFIILFHLIFNTGIGYQERIAIGAIEATKITTISLLVFLFTATTSINSIMLLFAFCPRKFKLVLTITFGILPAVMEEARNIKLIQNARGLHTNSFNLYKSFFPLIIPLLHRSFQRAERIATLVALHQME